MFDLEYDGKLIGLDCKTFNECENEANDWFAGQWADEPMRNGDIREEDAYIVGFDDDGEEETRYPVKLFYEYYHGDFREHNIIGM